MKRSPDKNYSISVIIILIMGHPNSKVAEVGKLLKKRLLGLKNKTDILKAVELKALYAEIPQLDPKDRAGFGKAINDLKAELEQLVSEADDASGPAKEPIDVTAPFDVNAKLPALLPSEHGSRHPLMTEIEKILDIYYRMGFKAVESRQIDDDYHMFPADHPARDEYDTFMTTEGLIAPAHTSVMQTRVMSADKKQLEEGKPIAYVVPGRVFRNEDLDARHEHTFYQLEGVYVGEGINVGNLIAVLQTFFEEYYGKKMEVKTQPFYFPFTEPSFEFAIACPFCDKAGCKVCGEGWLEMLGCGMIHPNVLKMAGIDPVKYSGFAWGGGVDRLVMIKYGIDDVRHFHSGKLEFLRQFS